MLGSEAVRELEQLVHRRMYDKCAVFCQRLLDSHMPAQRFDLCFELRCNVACKLLGCRQQETAPRIVLGLCDQIGCDEIRAARLIRDYNDLAGPEESIDANPTGKHP